VDAHTPVLGAVVKLSRAPPLGSQNDTSAWPAHGHARVHRGLDQRRVRPAPDAIAVAKQKTLATREGKTGVPGPIPSGKCDGRATSDYTEGDNFSGSKNST
jgi:hypothetical protein